jgi:hypothetical protein
MKSPIFLDVMPYSPLKISQRFGGTCGLHFQGLSISQARNEYETGNKRNRVYSHSAVYEDLYCGVFMPCKNCNINTRSHDYATVNEAVFSPSRTEPSRDESRVASPSLICCQATTINTWMTQEWGRVPWPRQQWRNNWSVFPQVRWRVYRRDWS